jgi:integrase/recombinase XerD
MARDAMSKIEFESPLADRRTSYVSFKRSLGFELRSQVYTLRAFDRVLEQHMRRPGPVTRALLESFLRGMDGLQPLTRRMRLGTLRQFLLYLQQYEPETFVPDPMAFALPRCSPRAPHIYTDAEVHALLYEAVRFPFAYPNRRWCLYQTFIACLYATGMRVGEALALNLEDIDWTQRALRIRRAKFHKARLVPLASSSCRGLQQYVRARAERGHPTLPGAPLFVGPNGGRLSYRTALGAFAAIRRRAGLQLMPGGRYPRLHDLRHTAAVRRLYLWYREGKDVHALLPLLVTYLGHSHLSGTEIYLTMTWELLAEAGARYDRYLSAEATHGPRP